MSSQGAALKVATSTLLVNPETSAEELASRTRPVQYFNYSTVSVSINLKQLLGMTSIFVFNFAIK